MSEEITFLGLEPLEPGQCNAIIFSAPYERTTSYLKGTAQGPQAILKASHQVEFFDVETKTEACLQGIYTYPPFQYGSQSADECLDLMAGKLLDAFQGAKFPILLGGEHTVTLAPVRAAAKAFQADKLSILHLDAHSDVRQEYEDDRYSHACVMRRIHELIPRSYSVGIRAQCVEEWQYLHENKTQYGVLYDHERHQEGLSVSQALKYLPTEKIYITIDLDYFSPHEVPSVGTPVPGGGNWYETLKFLREIFEAKDVVGVDIVELKPDRDERSAFLAAQLVYKLITYRFLSKA